MFLATPLALACVAALALIAAPSFADEAAGKRPVIGITVALQSPESHAGSSVVGAEKQTVNGDYVNAVAAAGGLPLLLPLVADVALVRAQIEHIDGLLVSGGPDVNPLLYGEEPKPALETVQAERDAYELVAIRAAAELGKPILGICRGLQVMNVSFGGTLYQDLGQKGPDVLKHSQRARRDVATHSVALVADTLLYNILQTKTIQVNSFHHQAPKTVAPGFVISALSPDGVIEALENPRFGFMLGVQWHPESMAPVRSDMLKLFKAFVDAARR